MNIIDVMKQALIDSGVSATQVNAMGIEQLVLACNCRNIQIQISNNSNNSSDTAVTEVPIIKKVEEQKPEPVQAPEPVQPEPTEPVVEKVEEQKPEPVQAPEPVQPEPTELVVEKVKEQKTEPVQEAEPVQPEPTKPVVEKVEEQKPETVQEAEPVQPEPTEPVVEKVEEQKTEPVQETEPVQPEPTQPVIEKVEEKKPEPVQEAEPVQPKPTEPVVEKVEELKPEPVQEPEPVQPEPTEPVVEKVEEQKPEPVQAPEPVQPEPTELVVEKVEELKTEPAQTEAIKPEPHKVKEDITKDNTKINNSNKQENTPTTKTSENNPQKTKTELQAENIDKLKEVLNENQNKSEVQNIDFSKACTRHDPYTIAYNKLIEKKNRQLSMTMTALKNGRPMIALKLFWAAMKIGYEACSTPKNIPDTYVRRGAIYFIANLIICGGGIFASEYEPPEQMQMLLGSIDRDKDSKALKQLLKHTQAISIETACNNLINKLEIKSNECEAEIAKLTRQLLKGAFKTEEEIINYYKVQTTNRYSMNTIDKTMNFYQEINSILVNKRYMNALRQEDINFSENSKKQRVKKTIKELEGVLKDLLLAFDPNLRGGLIEDLKKEIFENNN